MLVEFYYIFIYSSIMFLLSSILSVLSLALVKRVVDIEKISAYECGFQPFEDTRSKFDVRFYLVAILFLIFDLEVTFLFPYILVCSILGLFGLVAMFAFVFLLTVGFVYEWQKGALEWD